VVQKAYNKEKRQSSLITGTGTALLAYSSSTRPSDTVDHYTYYNKDRYTEAKCFLKHPYLKKEFDNKRKARDKKRKRTSRGRGDFKKLKNSSSSTSSEQITDISDTGALTVSYIAINTFISGNITPIPIND
jgi:hypothetical protein